MSLYRVHSRFHLESLNDLSWQQPQLVDSSKLIAGHICVTLKDFWIVWVGQDSCYKSLYMIECSLIDLIPEVGHTMVLLIWLLGQPHLRWEWGAIIPSSPVVMIVFYHAMEVSCYHFFWAVKSRLCLRLVTLGLLFSASRYFIKVRRMSNLSALTCKLLKDPSRLSNCS